MKILYANGDSWTHGDEIPQTTPAMMQCKMDRYYGSWPWYLAQKLDAMCLNEAGGAGSNARIFRKTADYILNYMGQKRDPKLLTVIIGWTTQSRTEISHKSSYFKVTPNGVYGNFSIPDADKELLHEYQRMYLEVHDPELSLEEHVRYMLVLRAMCENFGIEYHDFVAIGNHPAELESLAEKKFNLKLSNLVNGFTWNQYVVECNHSVYEHKHPTTETHEKWANFLFSRITM